MVRLQPTDCMQWSLTLCISMTLHILLWTLVGIQVCTAIKPESAEAVYLMLLDKSPTQEEFIRGQLTNNPYNSAEVGPLMRDIKNFICRELDMEGEMSFPIHHSPLTIHCSPFTNHQSCHGSRLNDCRASVTAVISQPSMPSMR